MYVTHHLMVIVPCAKYGKYVPMSNQKSYEPDTKTCQKTKFDLEVQGHHRIGIPNVRDTSSHSDIIMCQLCLANFKPKKIMDGTQICTNRRTDKVIPIYTPEHRSRGIK